MYEIAFSCCVFSYFTTCPGTQTGATVPQHYYYHSLNLFCMCLKSLIYRLPKHVLHVDNDAKEKRCTPKTGSAMYSTFHKKYMRMDIRLNCN